MEREIEVLFPFYSIHYPEDVNSVQLSSGSKLLSDQFSSAFSVQEQSATLFTDFIQIKNYSCRSLFNQIRQSYFVLFDSGQHIPYSYDPNPKNR